MNVEVWIADTRALDLDRRLEQMLAGLPIDAREKALRFVRREDRLRCAVGRMMIRALAEKELGNPDAPLRIGAYGKPFFAGEGAPQFNLSHAGRLVVLATGEIPVGVDVEERREMDWREIAFTFSEAERAIIESAKDPLLCFYRLWTVREAFSKEAGIGLSIFEQGAMEYGRETIRFRGETWQYRTWEFPDYTLSLCAKQLEGVQLRWLSPTSFLPASLPSSPPSATVRSLPPLPEPGALSVSLSGRRGSAESPGRQEAEFSASSPVSPGSGPSRPPR